MTISWRERTSREELNQKAEQAARIESRLASWRDPPDQRGKPPGDPEEAFGETWDPDQKLQDERSQRDEFLRSHPCGDRDESHAEHVLLDQFFSTILNIMKNFF